MAAHVGGFAGGAGQHEQVIGQAIEIGQSLRIYRFRSGKGNWTISLRSVAPGALWEASDIVSDIQEAYELTAAA